MVPVTPPEGDISPSSKLHPKSMGKAPGMLTQSGWTSLDVNNVKFRCHDYAAAKLWCEDWGANTGFVAGDGYVVFDNDEGREFSLVLRGLLANAPRRYVQDPKHERDAFFVRVLDFVGDGAQVANAELTFRNGVRVAKLSILAKGKQSVIGGTHPGTRAPYVWDRDIADIADIPSMTEDMFDLTVKKLIKELNSQGWSLDGPPPRPVSGVSAAPVAIATSKAKLAPNPNTSSPRFAHARSLLAMIPNRDILPNITLSPADRWLDGYDGWIEAAYMLAAFLEDDVLDPEAEEVFTEWSDGKTQIKQSSRDLWRSVRNQPIRFQPLALPKKVQELTQGEPDFPDDIDPDDPAMQVKLSLWEAMRERWAFCAVQKGFVDTASKRVLIPPMFSSEYQWMVRDLRKEIGSGVRKDATVALLFLTRPDRKAVLDVTYAPGEPRFIFTPGEPMPIYNSWRPTTTVSQTVTALQVKPWLDHILFVLGSDAERDLFLRWCAFAVRHPELKPKWHYLVISDQGLGKDTMLYPVKLAIGEGNWYENLSSALVAGFDYAAEHKFLILSETHQTSRDAHAGAAKLKQLMTSDGLWINKKNQHPYYVPNRSAVVIFSNEENPLPLEVSQRRVYVVDRRHEKPNPSAYYKQLYAWFNNGGVELAAAYLLNYPLTDADLELFVGGVAPPSVGKTVLEQMNLPAQQATLEDLIADAREGIVDGVPANLVANVDELSQMIRDRGLRQPTPQQIGRWLLALERANRGVRRYRKDRNNPDTTCGVVHATVGGRDYSGRLWLLADKTADGRDWDRLPTAEIISIWKNLPIKNATVTPFPSKARGEFPDDEDVV
jgi:hypothetical protein